MNNEQYINNMTLEYLLNPILYEKIYSEKNNTNKLLSEDILFYKQRISKLTKDMCKGNFINDNFKTIFLNYAASIVYYLKQMDEKDIFQSYYADLTLESSENIENEQLLTDISQSNIDNLIINKPQITNNLNTFVKRINIDQEEKILPQRRVANITDPKLKKKGLKKKI